MSIAEHIMSHFMLTENEYNDLLSDWINNSATLKQWIANGMMTEVEAIRHIEKILLNTTGGYLCECCEREIASEPNGFCCRCQQDNPSLVDANLWGE